MTEVLLIPSRSASASQIKSPASDIRIDRSTVDFLIFGIFVILEISHHAVRFFRIVPVIKRKDGGICIGSSQIIRNIPSGLNI